MEIVKIPIAQLNPAEYNPRTDLKPGQAEYERIKRSIEEYGLVEPLVWNRRTGRLVGGHQRLKILADLGYKEAAVSVVDLTEDRERALNVALNKLGGDWDRDKLGALISTMEEDIAALTGFGEQEIEDLLLQVQIDHTEQRIIDEKVESLMGKPVDRPTPGPPEDRITITITGDPEIFTSERLADLRATWAPLGVQITQEGGRQP